MNQNLEIADLTKSINQRELDLEVMRKATLVRAQEYSAEALLQGAALIRLRNLEPHEWTERFENGKLHIPHWKAQGYMRYVAKVKGREDGEAVPIQTLLLLADTEPTKRDTTPPARRPAPIEAIHRACKLSEFVLPLIDKWTDAQRDHLARELHELARKLWPCDVPL